MAFMQSGGPAFPTHGWTAPNDEPFWPEPGMTLRDWFAGQALAGLVLNPNIHLEDAAYHAYSQADAMLKAREQSNA